MRKNVPAGVLFSIILGLVAALPAAAKDTLYRSPGNLEYGVYGRAGRFLDKRCYVINYCDEWRIPYWSAYYLNKDSLFGRRKRQEKFFQPDTAMPVGNRAVKADYKRSGFDRGHLAPAADFQRRLNAYISTFLLSNMSPQRGAANREVSSRIEDTVRQLVRQGREAWIVVGNTMLDAAGYRMRVIPDSNWIWRGKYGTGQRRVAVPTHLFRAVLVRDAKGGWQAWAFLVKNSNVLKRGWRIRDYELTVDSLEKLTGWDFFSSLPGPVQARVEARLPH